VLHRLPVLAIQRGATPPQALCLSIGGTKHKNTGDSDQDDYMPSPPLRSRKRNHFP
ncbi:uncharacterized protein METZ01_LOCUS89279, partial [marine metagenome]